MLASNVHNVPSTWSATPATSSGGATSDLLPKRRSGICRVEPTLPRSSALRDEGAALREAAPDLADLVRRHRLPPVAPERGERPAEVREHWREDREELPRHVPERGIRPQHGSTTCETTFEATFQIVKLPFISRFT